MSVKSSPSHLKQQNGHCSGSEDGGGGGGDLGSPPKSPKISSGNGPSLEPSCDKDAENAEEVSRSSRWKWIALVAIFGASILLLVTIYSTFPNLPPEEKDKIKLPRNIEDAKALGRVLSRYKDLYYFEVLGGVLLVYIFLQTFAIPGSIFLSILSGYLFNFWVALPLVCFCSAMGATCCYGLSWLVGRRLIYKYFPERVTSWSVTVNRHRDNLLNYIIFLRVTPFLPNWFINITSPVLGVPVTPFFVGTFLGVAPPSFVAIQAGTTLNLLTSSSDAVSWTSLVLLIVLGTLSLIPVLLKQRLKDKYDKEE